MELLLFFNSKGRKEVMEIHERKGRKIIFFACFAPSFARLAVKDLVHFAATAA